MVLATLKFRGCSLRYNPIKLQIKNSFRSSRYIVPMGNTSVQSIQPVPVVYTGVGELFGEDCIGQYRELEKVFLEGRKGVLCLPDMIPTQAWFTGLELIGDTKENLLKYRFEFTQADTSLQTPQRSVHICKEGETLYDIAYEYGVRVEKLVKLNPFIRRPDELRKGEQVRLC